MRRDGALRRTEEIREDTDVWWQVGKGRCLVEAMRSLHSNSVVRVKKRTRGKKLRKALKVNQSSSVSMFNWEV